MNSTTSFRLPASITIPSTTCCSTSYVSGYAATVGSVLFDLGGQGALLHILLLDRAQDSVQWVEPLRVRGGLEPDAGDPAGGRGGISRQSPQPQRGQLRRELVHLGHPVQHLRALYQPIPSEEAPSATASDHPRGMIGTYLN